jgi:hypothetical protein
MVVVAERRFTHKPRRVNAADNPTVPCEKAGRKPERTPKVK